MNISMTIQARKLRWSAFHSTLFLAMMLHLLSLFIYIVLSQDTERGEFALIRDVEVISSNTVEARAGHTEQTSRFVFPQPPPRIAQPRNDLRIAERSTASPAVSAHVENAREMAVPRSEKKAEGTDIPPDSKGSNIQIPHLPRREPSVIPGSTADRGHDGRNARPSIADFAPAERSGSTGSDGEDARRGDRNGGGRNDGNGAKEGNVADNENTGDANEPGESERRSGDRATGQDSPHYGKGSHWDYRPMTQGAPRLRNTGAWDAMQQDTLDSIGSGSVRMRLTIPAEGGKPRIVDVVEVRPDDTSMNSGKSRKEMAFLAYKMAQDSRWEPGYVNGQPEEMNIEVTIILVAGSEIRR